MRMSVGRKTHVDLRINLLVMVNVVDLVTVYVLEPAVKVVGVGQTVT